MQVNCTLKGGYITYITDVEPVTWIKKSSKKYKIFYFNLFFFVIYGKIFVRGDIYYGKKGKQ